MNRPVPIPQIAGVPPQLTQAVNNRLRTMQQSAAPAAGTPARTGGAGSGAIALYANGTLAIQADAAPAVWLNAGVSPTGVTAYVKTAPTGSGISATIYAGPAAWASFTIAAGATSATATFSGALPAGQDIRLALTAVGSTVPGADLSVFVYF